ncbi:MAG: lysoplasmalogenase family protein [Coriobacteriia bacterium]|nr:lysoplasmalogenase family protein [Coriobacteriia bacterium]
MTLLNVFILFLVSGCFLQLSFITCDSHGYMKSAVLLKGLASFCFAGCGLIAFLFLLDRYNGDFIYPILVCFGLIAGAVGDIALGIRHTLKKGSIPYHGSFLLGIVCFLGGHVFYLASAIINLEQWFICVPIAVVCALIFVYFFFKILKAKPIYKIVGTVYVCILFSFVFCSVGKVIECIAEGIVLDTAPGLAVFLIAVASIVFTISDILTVYNAFGPKKHPTMRLFSLSLYYAAQIVIASSLLFLVN